VPTNFQMVAWFNPHPDLHTPGVSKEEWIKQFGSFETVEVEEAELRVPLVDFLKGKQYVKPGRDYIVICEFGLTFTFRGGE